MCLLLNVSSRLFLFFIKELNGIFCSFIGGVKAFRKSGTAYPSRAPGFTPSYLVGYVLLIFLALCVVVYFLLCPVSCVPSVSGFPLRFSLAFVFDQRTFCMKRAISSW